MIDDVLSLMLKSDMHRDWYISDLERLVLPAIEAKRMTVVYEDAITTKTQIFPRPTGLFSHTFLTKEAETGYALGTRKLQSEDWLTGPEDGTLYMIDFIAPYDNVLKICRFAQDELTGRYFEVNRASFVRQMNGKKKGYVPGKIKRRHEYV